MANYGFQPRDPNCVRLALADPKDTCEFEIQQKLKGRWTHVACSSPAEFALVITQGDDQVVAKFCKVCLGYVAKDIISILTH